MRASSVLGQFRLRQSIKATLVAVHASLDELNNLNMLGFTSRTIVSEVIVECFLVLVDTTAATEAHLGSVAHTRQMRANRCRFDSQRTLVLQPVMTNHVERLFVPERVKASALGTPMHVVGLVRVCTRRR